MNNVLIIGGGLAGCTVARTLSDEGLKSTVLELSPQIGGKVREYGCKADTECNQCGVCITGNLWEATEKDSNINILLNSKLVDLWPDEDGFTAYIEHNNKFTELKATEIVLANGFLESDTGINASLEIYGSDRVITGTEMERIFKYRTASTLLPSTPTSVAFILCHGSRSVKDKSQYCSQVCCSYATRMAKVIRHYYNECNITFFYMDIQTVGDKHDVISQLEESNIRLVRCRPARIVLEGELPEVLYENTEGTLSRESFEYVILCDGIHPNESNVALSDITGLRVNRDGFLEYVQSPEMTHIFIAGCASGPKFINETVSQSREVGLRIAQLNRQGGVQQ